MRPSGNRSKPIFHQDAQQQSVNQRSTPYAATHAGSPLEKDLGKAAWTRMFSHSPQASGAVHGSPHWALRRAHDVPARSCTEQVAARQAGANVATAGLTLHAKSAKSPPHPRDSADDIPIKLKSPRPYLRIILVLEEKS
eukprot:scaffold189_cov249-Pinguiococcus_pyrenoidosus.AAC.22